MSEDGPNSLPHSHTENREKTHLLILPDPLDVLSLALFLLNILVGQAEIPQKSNFSLYSCLLSSRCGSQSDCPLTLATQLQSHSS